MGQSFFSIVQTKGVAKSVIFQDLYGMQVAVYHLSNAKGKKVGRL